MPKIPQNIAIIVPKFLDGTASSDELEQLHSWYNSFDDKEVLVSSTNNANEKLLFKRIESRIEASISALKQSDKVPNSPKYWLAAASIVLLVGVFSYFYNNTSVEAPNTGLVQADEVKQIQVSQENVIVPGGNKAVLTLADGSIIVLDSAVNGMLGVQGNVEIKKLDNGQIAYLKDGKEITAGDPEFYNTISTPRGGQYQITLSDGTNVWLNASSSIRFPVAFSVKERSIEITGEVYLEVRKDASRPFSVQTRNSVVQVLGTSFNINSYDDETAVSTTLIEGKVETFSDATPNYKQTIRPGEQTQIGNNGKIRVVHNADIAEVLAWKNGLFQFNSTGLQSIVKQLSRWYDVEIINSRNRDMKFTGQLPRTENIQQILSKLELTEEVKFKFEGRKIIIL